MATYPTRFPQAPPAIQDHETFNLGVLVERERCAKIAEGEKVDAELTNCADDIAYNLACDHIAAAIRSGK